jgi:DNA modification methylase
VTVQILHGDCIQVMKTLPADSVDCVVTSPPYWGLRDYNVDGQHGLEKSLGEHLDLMVNVFREVRRILKPTGTLWLNYGDCYATTPNGKKAAEYKADGSDDRTFRDKPFSTIGPVYDPDYRSRKTFGLHGEKRDSGGRVVSGGTLKPKDLCMIPNRLAIELQADGWWVRSEIIWAKPNQMPESIRDRPATSHEKIFMLTKSAKYFFNKEEVAQKVSPNTNARLSQDLINQIGSARANGGRKTNGNMKAVSSNRKMGTREAGVKNNRSFSEAVCLPTETRNLRNYEPAPVQLWEMASQPCKFAHFATFPPELVERCLKAGCPQGGVVFDPYGGAGTTGLVAAQMGLEAILVELNPEYIEIAQKRLKAGLLPVRSSIAEKSNHGPLFGDQT